MPIHKTKDGKWQYGEAGKKYESKEKAIKQGLAILYSQAKEEGKKKPDKEDLEKHLAVRGDAKKQQKTASALVGMGLRKMAEDQPERPTELLELFNTYKKDFIGDAPEGYADDEAPWYKFLDAFASLKPNVGITKAIIKDWRDLKGANSRARSPKTKLENLNAHKADLESRLNEYNEEYQADKDGIFSAKAISLRAPSYLGFSLAGALVGRLIAGKKYRWWGYGGGLVLGGLLNYLRRTNYYGTKA